jgi:hypothetical protein
MTIITPNHEALMEIHMGLTRSFRKGYHYASRDYQLKEYRRKTGRNISLRTLDRLNHDLEACGYQTRQIRTKPTNYGLRIRTSSLYTPLKRAYIWLHKRASKLAKIAGKKLGFDRGKPVKRGKSPSCHKETWEEIEQGRLWFLEQKPKFLTS